MNSLHDLGPAADGHEVKRLHSAGPSCHEGQGPWGQHFWLCACKVSCPCYCNQDYNSPMGAIARGQDCYFFLAQVIQKSVEFVGFRNFYFPIPMVERWWLWPWLNFKERISTGSQLKRQEPEGAGPWVSALETSFLCPATASSVLVNWGSWPTTQGTLVVGVQSMAVCRLGATGLVMIGHDLVMNPKYTTETCVWICATWISVRTPDTKSWYRWGGARRGGAHGS